MAALWTRMRLHYIGNIRVSRLVTPLVLLILVYIVFRWARGPTHGIVRYRPEAVEHKMSHGDIDHFINALQDTRPQHCSVDYRKGYSGERPTVSILVDFHEDEFYNLKLTLSSIVAHTPRDIYDEIILLDDGSTNFPIRKHAADFIKHEKFDRLRAFRSDAKHGQGVTRYKTSQVAKSDILVFVGSSTVVNVGWLEPLIGAVRENNNRMVVPHSDNFLSDFRFYQMNENLVTTFSWPLTTVYTEGGDSTAKYMRVPVMRGDVVAVSRTFLGDIGNYDEGMGTAGGHDIELSLRTWLCGGEIVKAVCSRIAVHSALKPVDINNDVAFRRIAELWLGEYKGIAYKQGAVDKTISSEESLTISTRRSLINKSLQCKNFQWYLENVASGILAPSEDMLRYGKLKTLSAHCASTVSDDSSQIELVLCRPYMYDQLMIFEMDEQGFIRMGDLCLMAPGVASRILLTNCQEDNQLQKWIYTSEGHFKNKAHLDMCLTHVTRSVQDTNQIHFMQLSPCMNDGTPKQTWNFINY